MVVIRLARGGKKGAPVFMLMVAEKSAALGGRFIEKLGTYVPSTAKEALVFNKDRYDFWLSKGAQASDRVKLLMKTVAKGKQPRQPKVKPKAAPEAETASASEAAAE
jgi:small subunit ribosomal protein S16